MADMNQTSGEIEQKLFNPQANQQQEDGKAQDPYANLAGAISDLDRRLRILEERYANLRQKMQLSDQNMLEAERSFIKDIRGANEDVMQLKRDVNDFSEKVVMFSDEMDSTAKKKDLKVIEKYFELWSPTNFVTRKELRDFLRDQGINVVAKDEETEEPSEEEES